jgi:hypothetical protein
MFTKDQRNEVFRALVTGGLDPAACDTAFLPDRFDLGHRPTLSTFSASYKEGYWFYKRKLGSDPEISAAMGRTWGQLSKHIEKWARDVVEWADAPDLWATLSGGSVIPGDLSSESENTPFTPDEQAAISGQLKDIAESIKKAYELTAEQSAEIDKKFEEAEKASRRMGRKDWGLLVGGAVFSLILADVITPGVAGHILMMIEHGIGYLFMGNPPTVGGILGAGGD